jgi:hypothetical protein
MGVTWSECRSEKNLISKKFSTKYGAQNQSRIEQPQKRQSQKGFGR